MLQYHGSRVLFFRTNGSTWETFFQTATPLTDLFPHLICGGGVHYPLFTSFIGSDQVGCLTVSTNHALQPERPQAMANPCANNSRGKDDLISSKLAWLLWYLPLAVFIVGTFWAKGRIWVWTPALMVAGISCVINATRCGRFHCRFTGPLYLFGALATLLSGLGVLALRWSWIFSVILVGTFLAFVPEWIGRKYTGHDQVS